MYFTLQKPHPTVNVDIDYLFSAFRYCCAARGEKLEKSKISYACMAQVVREGGFKIALIARFSAIPGHCEHFRFPSLSYHLSDFWNSYVRDI